MSFVKYFCLLMMLFSVACNNPVQRPPSNPAPEPQIFSYLKTAFRHDISEKLTVYFFIPMQGCHGCVQSMLVNAPTFKKKNDPKNFSVKIALTSGSQGAVNKALKSENASQFDFIEMPLTCDRYGISTQFPSAAVVKDKIIKKYYIFQAEHTDSCWTDLKKTILRIDR